MSEIIVDTERLAHDLETGLPEVDPRCARMQPEYRLRYRNCDLISSAIAYHLQSRGTTCQTKDITPNLEFDSGLEHTALFLDEASDNPVFLDASHSQFLGWVGLTLVYERVMKVALFPQEKILVSRFSDLNTAIRKFADMAIDLRAQIKHPDNYPFDKGALHDAPYEKVLGAYQRLFDTRNYHPSKSPNEVSEPAIKLASFISDQCITIF